MWKLSSEDRCSDFINGWLCFQQKFWKNCLLNYFYIHYPPQISIHSVFFYAPASNEMARAYSITLFCHSVLSSLCPSVILSSFTFQSISQQMLHTFNSNFIYGCVIDIFRLSLKKNRNSQFSLFNFWRDTYIKLMFHM